MTRGVAGPGKARDFVLRKARRREPHAQPAAGREQRVFVGQRELPARSSPRERRFRLDRERVSRNVWNPETNHAFEVRQKLGLRLPGRSEDQVGRDGLETSPQARFESTQRLRSRVRAPELPERLVAQGLNADGKPCHAGRAKARHPTDLAGSGIEFERDLLGLARKALSNRSEQTLDRGGLEQGGRSTPEVDAAQHASRRRPRGPREGEIELDLEPLEVAAFQLRREAPRRLDGKVAVRANPLAERQVHVDADVGRSCSGEHGVYPKRGPPKRA